MAGLTGVIEQGPGSLSISRPRAVILSVYRLFCGEAEDAGGVVGVFVIVDFVGEGDFEAV